MEDEDRKFPPIKFEEDGDSAPEAFNKYVRVGRKIYAWATGAEKTPANMAELRKELGGDIFIPDGMTNLEVCQGEDETPGDTTFVLRLPPINQVMESQEQMKQKGTAKYPTPELYTFLVMLEATNLGKRASAEDVLYSRIADYTMRGCR
ncbi:MAG: hypothetical protein GY748_17075 [Planctomycetaceae bacterium]|nr:hypothetical protein [Planctomycetaceae bacterium]